MKRVYNFVKLMDVCLELSVLRYEESLSVAILAYFTSIIEFRDFL